MALRTRAKLSLFILAGSVLVAGLGLWRYREPIARDALDSYFAQHGVKASYKIKAIETRRQRLEQVRIGDPAQPDLVADWVEIDVGPSLTGLSVKAFRAGGLRLWGKQTGEKISFGSLDRLLPAPSGSAFRLPRVDLALEDARLAFESPYGRAGLRLDGQGNLRSGFEGKLALVSPRLGQAGCAAEQVQLYGDVSVIGARPTYTGPVRFAALRCGSLTSGPGDVRLDASLSEDARNWRGSGRWTLSAVTALGLRLPTITGGGEFSGDAQQTKARFEVQAYDLSAPSLTAKGLTIAAKASIGPQTLLVDGQAKLRGAQAIGQVHEAQQALAGLASAPVIGPLARQLAQAVARTGPGVEGAAGFSLTQKQGQMGVALSDIRLAAGRGGFVAWPGKAVVRYDAAGLSLAGAARFGGSGFPAGRAQFAGRRAEIVMAPYRAPGAEARFTPISLWWTGKGIGVATQVVLNGPLGRGRIKGLTIPLRLQPGQVMPQGCFPLRFQSAYVDAARIGPTRLTSCSNGQDIWLAAPELRGKWGQAPLRFRAAEARFSPQRRTGFVRSLGLHWGQGQDASYLQVAELTSQPRRTGFGGQIMGLEGQLANIPLHIRQMAGQWQTGRAGLDVMGSAMLSDGTSEPRFLPLRAADVRANLANGTLHASTQLREPQSDKAVANIALVHQFGPAQGHADIIVPTLAFGPDLQPEALTSVTKGVVANVMGAVSGKGRIDWAQGQVRSSGSFRSSGLDFAAAFGPVRGLAGAIRFSDLLGLVTDGVQEARVTAINPGVEVEDGLIRYRLLPDFKVAVEGGRWPFAGGNLVLEPTLLDMSESAERHLTFRAEGLDAARFIAAMQFENIAATGVYDGVLPMVFDAQGGRIVGGRLVAQGGGTVSYVGPVSNENLGLMGRFAFDALKSMRYSRLAIDLNGAIDGDVITRVSFAGVNQAPVSGGRTRLPIKVLGASNIPFVFNVTITAKFRQLFNMARSVNDPSVFISRAYPHLLVEPGVDPKAPKPVQPADRPKPQ